MALPELYPPGLPPRSRLGRYAAAFPSAELNSSFHRWPSPAAFRSWRGRLPDGFRLSVKAPRGLTHARKLYAPEPWLQRIREGWHELGDKRAVLLVQLPPSQPRDDTRLAYFLQLIPDWMRVAVDRSREWSLAGQDVYVYFNNDGNANAVRNARTLQALLPAGRVCARSCASGRPVSRSSSVFDNVKDVTAYRSKDLSL